jgi:hypothetical protein
LTGPQTPAELTVFGYPTDSVTAVCTLILAVGTIFLAAATAGLVYAAFKQIPLLTAQIKLARESEEKLQARQIEINTITACAKYDTDPVIHEVNSRLWKQSNGGKDYSSDNIDRLDLIIMLNYLDGIAIGVKQGVLSNAITKDHLGAIYIKVVDIIIPAVFGNFDDYEAIEELRRSWKSPKPPAYTSQP